LERDSVVKQHPPPLLRPYLTVWALIPALTYSLPASACSSLSARLTWAPLVTAPPIACRAIPFRDGRGQHCGLRPPQCQQQRLAQWCRQQRQRSATQLATLQATTLTPATEEQLWPQQLNNRDWRPSQPISQEGAGHRKSSGPDKVQRDVLEICWAGHLF